MEHVHGSEPEDSGEQGMGIEIPGYPYTPVNEGQILSYGDYHLETVGLKGGIPTGRWVCIDRNHSTLLRGPGH